MSSRLITGFFCCCCCRNTKTLALYTATATVKACPSFFFLFSTSVQLIFFQYTVLWSGGRGGDWFLTKTPDKRGAIFGAKNGLILRFVFRMCSGSCTTELLYQSSASSSSSGQFGRLHCPSMTPYDWKLTVFCFLLHDMLLLLKLVISPFLLSKNNTGEKCVCVCFWSNF